MNGSQWRGGGAGCVGLGLEGHGVGALIKGRWKKAERWDCGGEEMQGK